MQPGSELFRCHEVLIETMALDPRIENPEQREEFKSYISPTTISNICVRKQPDKLVLEVPASSLISFIDKDKDFILTAAGRVIGAEGDELVEWSINEQTIDKQVMSNFFVDIKITRIVGRFTTSVKSIRPRTISYGCALDDADKQHFASVSLQHRPTQILVGIDPDDSDFAFDHGNLISVGLVVDEASASPKNVVLHCNVTEFVGQGLRPIDLTAAIREVPDEFGVNGIYPGGVARFAVVLKEHGSSDLVYDAEVVAHSWSVRSQSYGSEIRPKNVTDSPIFEVQLGDAPSTPSPGTSHMPPDDVLVSVNINVDGVTARAELLFKPDNAQTAERKRILTLISRWLLEHKCPLDPIRWLFGIK